MKVPLRAWRFRNDKVLELDTVRGSYRSVKQEAETCGIYKRFFVSRLAFYEDGEGRWVQYRKWRISLDDPDLFFTVSMFGLLITLTMHYREKKFSFRELSLEPLMMLIDPTYDGLDLDCGFFPGWLLYFMDGEVRLSGRLPEAGKNKPEQDS